MESNTLEFTGLAGKAVTLQVEKSEASWVVYVVNGLDYRFADGSFA